VNGRVADFTALRQNATVEWLGAAISPQGIPNMRRLTVLAVACAIPSALFAQIAAAPPAEPAAAAEKPAKEKKICRREEETGSIMPTRICHTKDEWVRIDAANQKAVEQFSAARRDHGGSNSN
jgi:hypothetical protein